MVFEYYGNFEELRKEVYQYKDTIDRSYFDFLGKERFQRLEDTISRILSPDNFFEDPEKFKRSLNQKLPVNENQTSQQMFIHTISGLDDKWRINVSEGNATHAFYINKQSVLNGSSYLETGRLISSYIHEFDHFIISILQDPPQELLINLRGFSSPIPLTKLDNLMQFMQAIGSSNCNHPIVEKEKYISLAVLSFQYHAFSERSVNILDRNISRNIGIDFDIPWRGNKPKYTLINAGDLNFNLPHPNSDFFYGLNDKETIDKIINWRDNFKPYLDTEFIRDYINKISKIKVRLISMSEMKKKIRKKRKNRH
jgi:hypothetical protein